MSFTAQEQQEMVKIAMQAMRAIIQERDEREGRNANPSVRAQAQTMPAPTTATSRPAIELPRGEQVSDELKLARMEQKMAVAQAEKKARAQAAMDAANGRKAQPVAIPDTSIGEKPVPAQPAAKRMSVELDVVGTSEQNGFTVLFLASGQIAMLTSMDVMNEIPERDAPSSGIRKSDGVHYYNPGGLARYVQTRSPKQNKPGGFTLIKADNKIGDLIIALQIARTQP